MLLGPLLDYYKQRLDTIEVIGVTVEYSRYAIALGALAIIDEIHERSLVIFAVALRQDEGDWPPEKLIETVVPIGVDIPVLGFRDLNKVLAVTYLVLRGRFDYHVEQRFAIVSLWQSWDQACQRTNEQRAGVLLVRSDPLIGSFVRALRASELLCSARIVSTFLNRKVLRSAGGAYKEGGGEGRGCGAG